MVIDFDLTARLQLGLLGDVDDDPPGLLGVGRPVDLAAEPLHGGFELFEVAVEMGEGVFLDALGVIAELVAVGQGGVAAAVAGQERVGEPDQGGLQRRVGQGLVAGAEEVVMLVACVVGHLLLLSTRTSHRDKRSSAKTRDSGAENPI